MTGLSQMWISAWPMSTDSQIVPTPLMLKTDFLKTALTVISHGKCSKSGRSTQLTSWGVPSPDTLHPSLGTSAPAALLWEQGTAKRPSWAEITPLCAVCEVAGQKIRLTCSRIRI